MDAGGYFIISGTERVIPLAERRDPNRFVVYTKRAGKRTTVIGETVSCTSGRSYTLYFRCAKPDAKQPLLDVSVSQRLVDTLSIRLAMLNLLDAVDVDKMATVETYRFRRGVSGTLALEWVP